MTAAAIPIGNATDSDMARRREWILRRVDEFVKSYDEWANDEKTTVISPDSALGDMMEIMFVAVSKGDIPENCLELTLAINRLEHQWELYQQGEFVAHTLEPQPTFYAAVRAVVDARRGVSLPTSRLVESVRTLREQKVSDIQIAKIYGHRDGERWIGPFFNARSAVMSHLIDKEAEQPGSVIPASWEHPSDVANRTRRERELQTRLQRVDQRATREQQRSERIRSEERPTEQQVAEYLAEGAFLHQVLRQWPILTGEEVLAIAERRQVPLKTPQSTLYAPPADDSQSGEAEDGDDSGDVTQAVQSGTAGTPSDEQQREMVLTLIADNPEMPNQEIRERLIAAGGTLTPHQIAGLRREARKRGASLSSGSPLSSDTAAGIASDDDSDDDSDSED
jgi:hypothetical protein